MKASLAKRILTTLNTEEELAVYTGLTLMFDQMLSDVRDVVEVDIKPENIYYQLTGSHEVPKKMKTKIVDGINGLAKLGHLEILKADDKGYYVLDLKKFQRSDTDFYTSMDREEIRSIMAIDFKQRFNLLRFAVTVFGTFNMDKTQSCYKCGFSSLETLMELSNIKGKETSLTLFKLLEDNNIIYVRHSDRYSTSGETVKNVSNVYSRPCDKAYADNYYKDRFNKKSDDRSAREVCKEYKDKQEKTMEKPEAQKTVTKTYSSPAPIDDILAEDEELKAKINEKLKLTENTKPESEPAEEAVTTGITEEPENKHETETKVDNDDIFSDASFSSQYEETSRVKKARVTKNTTATEGQTPVGMPPRRPAGFVDETLTGDPKKDRKRGVFKSVDLNSIYKTPEEKEAAERIKQLYKPTALKVNDWEDDEIEDIDEEMACFEG